MANGGLFVSWEAIGVMVTVFGAAGTLGLYVLKLLLKAELSAFKVELLKELDERYGKAS